MKYLRKFNESQNHSEIDEICSKYDITNYTINSDGSIDVNKHVYLNNKKLTELPIKFRNVSGSFNCQNNQLTSLKGAPESVGGHFNCYNNQLTSLKGAPKSVGGNFNCSNNELTTLEGAPESISGSLYCSDNKLKYLEGATRSLSGIFYCNGCPISKWFNLVRKEDYEIFLDLNIHSDDPDEINQEKINIILNQ